MAGNPVRVAAGLVFKNDELLISKRPESVHLGGLWEFPGGKLEIGETYEDCVIREIYEELGIEVKVDYIFEEVLHQYGDITIFIKGWFISVRESGYLYMTNTIKMFYE